MVKVADSRDYIANYELNQYSYQGFWVGREYEHLAEVNLLHSLFRRYVPQSDSRTLVDLGGAYGRLLPMYGNLVKGVVLADYSTHELLTGKKRIDNTSFAENVGYVALNAYRLPFKNNSVDSLLSVRVMHHLRDLPLFIHELERVLVPGGVAIIEFANKNHILSLVKRWAKFDFSYSSKPVLQVAHMEESSQGMKEGQVAIMYNFSPKFVKKTMEDAGLVVKKMSGCSFLRLRFLKKIVPVGLLLFKEKLLQQLFGWFLITPSVFIVVEKAGKFVSSPAESLLTVNRLQCPTCGSEVRENSGVLTCIRGHVFPQRIEGVVDLRDPRPEKVDF
jgi:ubiquinone/menaquinone biosynthesis C-methylase UbiE